MGSWFRSQDMTFVYVIMNEDVAHECIRDIGRAGCMQFTDLNEHLTPFQRRYVSGVKRCDELERKVRFFTAETEKFGLRAASPYTPQNFLDSPPLGARSSAALLSELEQELETHEAHLLELNKFSEKLTSEYNEKVELHEVLSKSMSFFESAPVALDALHSATTHSALHTNGEVGSPLLDEDFGLIHDSREVAEGKGSSVHNEDAYHMRFSSMTGVIADGERARFERALFRSTRGNCYVRFADVEVERLDRSTTNSQTQAPPTCVFIVFYKSRAIEAKAKRIADAFGARRYSVPDCGGPDGARAVGEALRKNTGEIKDARTVLVKNQEMRFLVCRELAGLLQGWLFTILREKATFHALNALKPDVSGMLRGEGWVVSDEIEAVRDAVGRAHQRMALGGACVVDPLPLRSWPQPPTHFKTNAFTAPYQEFVDTYGVPRYKEANPALFTAVTFPFLFGLMYGDIGHGSCLALAGVYLCCTFTEDPRRGEMMAGMYSARYMLLMMGCFAVYAGLIYNDMFSLPLSLFTSQYAWPTTEGGKLEEGAVAAMTSHYGDGANVYAFGVDPSWHISSNELLFFNSMKMKISVILGILQMNCGILLRGMNAVYFKQPMDLWLEVVPMMLFAYGMFGYMIVLIFVKWTIDWDFRQYQATCNEDNGLWPACAVSPELYSGADLCAHGKHGLELGGESNGCQPPNLITTLINIALAPGTCVQPMFEGQASLQLAILVVAFVSVPVLLFGKPCAIGSAAKPKEKVDRDGDGLVSDDDSNDPGGHGGGGGGDDHGDDSFTEIVIHQAIETIEFVLGMVSNTASYLRLWALSLAHTELASVFWEKAMAVTIESKNPVLIFMGYSVFASVTFAVLLCMDVLECFLHALRLHWVEFQNKFYKADGYPFKPFALEPILRAAQ